ncbi:MAG TPA: PilW family protein [Pseudomonas sp.]|uniref:PilW family protein n=1 Tax=Pseudomonas sp. TaxID=306 RepID=UPI002B797BD2|nr:PilW family protein [Pseudomonas sp.]HSX88802.1 PilW family protein [Pseudomonas sp.]
MTRSSTPRQQGFSLVELMIAMVLGLLLMAGVLQTFLSSKQTYSTNNALARVQESGRFAMEFLTNDIRNAGYKGECISALNNLLNENGSGYSADLYDLNQPITGKTGESPSWVTNRTAGDVIHIKYAANIPGVSASGNTTANANAIVLNAASGVAQDAIIIVADPKGCDIFQNRSNANASALSRGNGGKPGNKNSAKNNFSHAYDSSMEVLRLESASYYIGNGVKGLPSLRRISFTSGAKFDEELVEGVEDMQILYGIAGSDRQVDSYVSASSVSNWDNVVSVRVHLLLASTDTNVVPENQIIKFNGKDVTIQNRRLAQVFSTTIGIRNRLP